MKDRLHASPGSLKDADGEATIRQDSEASGGCREGRAQRGGTADVSIPALEKDLSALLELCINLLQQEVLLKQLSRMRYEIRDIDAPKAAKLGDKEIVLRKIISLTEKRLRGADT